MLTRLRHNLILQYLFGIGLVSLVAILLKFVISETEYHVVALVLLLLVSILAMFLEVWPIVAVAIVSALLWNFMFIPPEATFRINTPQDALLFLMYFVIAIINGVFTSRIRKIETIAAEKKEREKTLKFYNTLFNSLSHELKTPVATLIGSVDVLREEEKLSQEVKNELLSEMETAGKRLHRQIEHFLSMSRLDNNYITLQKDWYDVNEIVFRVIEMNISDAQDRQLTYEPQDDLPLIKVDGPLIEQILFNIIHNATKYTPPASTIIVGVTIGLNSVIFSVVDNGKGFPDDQIRKVFQKFYRLPDSETGGTGLGLFIANGFAQAHNGRIELRNVSGGGAEFKVIIPCEFNYYKSFEDERS